MSDFVPSDLLPDLWEEILQQHWTFLETEEGIQKIEERKKLEGCLKEFLCVVPHDRKFFLPETAYVLRQSIYEMNDFTAYKALIGFESISQYANNLFTKPWRKEFRLLKMYSGFFQHEIESNLVHAIKLFEAMGYRRLSEEILILDGPICPDQVTNVSRDAMAAYVECQIMKQIYSGLSTMGIKCSWQDVFHYREKYAGGASQAIKGLAYLLQERRHRKEKLYSDSGYATLQHLSGAAPPVPPPPQSMVAQCSSCAPYHRSVPTQNCPMHSNQLPAGIRGGPGKIGIPVCNGVASGKIFSSYPSPSGCLGSSQQIPAHMTHSRSLDHYNEPANVLPHRHSFDHQQYQGQGHYQVPRPQAQYAQHLYESPYDCIDSIGGADGSLDGSSVSYAAVNVPANSQSAAYAHPYNVSGNRYPLPYNISNQLNSHYSTPGGGGGGVTCNGIADTGPYNPPTAIEHTYASVTKPSHNSNYLSSSQQRGIQSPAARHLNAHAATSKDFYSQRQRSFPPDQLIDFDDRAPLTSHDFNEQQQHQLRIAKHLSNYDNIDERTMRDYMQQQDQRRNLSRSQGLNSAYAEPKDILSQQYMPANAATTTSSDDAYGSSSLYARPIPRSSRTKDSSMLVGTQSKQMTDKYVRNSDQMQGYDDNNRKMPLELVDNGIEKLNGNARRKLTNQRNDRDMMDLNYEAESLDDYVTVGHSEHPQISTKQASKNQDGVGSFESWDYVFKILERSGYTKDLGERGDLLVQSLNLDSLKLQDGNSGGGGGGGGNKESQSVEKRRGADTTLTPGNKQQQQQQQQQLNGEKSRTLEKVSSTEKPKKQEKTSILKQTSAINGLGNKRSKSAQQNSSVSTADQNNLSNGHPVSVNGRNIKRQKSGSSTINATNSNNTLRSKQKPIVATTQVVASSPNEWTCRFCTLLNPNTTRICDVCAHTKDYILEPTVPNTPTCV